MTLGKREKLLIGTLAGLLYLLILVKFVIMPARSDIKDVNLNLHNLQTQKQQLDTDYANIDQTKKDLVLKKAQNEKLDSYIMINANMIDAVEYVDRLYILSGELNGVRISAPVQSANTNGLNYFETAIDFSLKVSQKKLFDIINYIEQGSFKATIKKIDIAGNDKGGNTYSVNMTICLYSMDKGSSDKFTEYSRHKLSEFSENNGVFFDPSASSLSPTSALANSNTLPGNGNPDISILEGSYMAAGSNLKIYGGINTTNSINVKTNKPEEVDISLSGTGYSVVTQGDDGNPVSLTGSLPDGDVYMSVMSDISSITENANIKLNVKIQNDTSKRLNITLKDNAGRVTILDRSNAAILGDSSKEKVLIY